jgi:hypothetical protein
MQGVGSNSATYCAVSVGRQDTAIPPYALEGPGRFRPPYTPPVAA